MASQTFPHGFFGCEGTIRVAAKVVALLAVYGTVFMLAQAVYDVWRDSNVRTIVVSKWADLEDIFEINPSTLRVRDPEFIKVCFTGDYVFALKDARHWFDAKESDFAPALRAAGGPADAFNGEGQASIVLLSRRSAVILRLDLDTGFSVANLGCAATDTVDIEIGRSPSGTGFYLPNATLKSPPGPGQPPVTSCAAKLQRLVGSIDELMVARVVTQEFFWAAVRKYLPATGCRAEEVISIVRKSEFFISGGGPSYLIMLRNADIRVSFRLEQDSGNIHDPDVSSTGLPFS